MPPNQYLFVELCRFLGIIIAMYYRDHGPPHFHAIYGEHEVTVEIETGAVNGRFPTRALSLVQEWRQAHQRELLEDRALAKDREPLKKIAPLE